MREKIQEGVKVQNITILYQSPKQYKKIEIQGPLGLSMKRQEPNPLKVNRKGPKRMGKHWTLRNKERRSLAQPLREKIAGGTQREN